MEDGLDDIVAVLVTYQGLKDTEIFLQEFEEKDLCLWAGVALDRTLDDIWRYFLWAIVQEVVTKEGGNLSGYLRIIIFEDLLDHIVSILIVDKLIELRQGDVD